MIDTSEIYIYSERDYLFTKAARTLPYFRLSPTAQTRSVSVRCNPSLGTKRNIPITNRGLFRDPTSISMNYTAASHIHKYHPN